MQVIGFSRAHSHKDKEQVALEGDWRWGSAPLLGHDGMFMSVETLRFLAQFVLITQLMTE